jgi:hypothetical protein
LMFIMLGCQRSPSNVHSKMSIRVPDAANRLNKTGGVGAMSAMPSDRKVCYGVNVTGLGVTGTPATNCSPATGLLGGFVDAGGSIEMQVTRGSKRTVELYAYLESPGQNSPCPKAIGPLPATDLAQIYKVGAAYNVDMSADETTVEILAEFPGLPNNIAQELALPAVCTATSGGAVAPGFHVSAGHQTATGTGIKMIGNVGHPVLQRTASGNGIQLVTE